MAIAKNGKKPTSNQREKPKPKAKIAVKAKKVVVKQPLKKVAVKKPLKKGPIIFLSGTKYYVS